MSDIFREVDEEVRREHYGRLWKRYGKYVIGIAAVIVVAVAGYQGWTHWRQSALDDQAAAYAQAVELAESGQTQAALERYTALADKDLGGYPTLARFQAAQLRAEQGDVAGAVAAWDGIASDGSVGQIWQDLATIFSVMHQVDTGDAAALESRLQPLMQPGRPFAITAIELSATLALKQGANQRAAELLRQITDNAQAPQAARARASQLLRLVQ